ncbi:zinc finger CCCH domain-containing protein 11A isoform X2 [Stigmatopora argus]
MTNHGDDCYFFYYSTCTNGDSCPFRHCEAAMGNETVCSLWQEGHCFRNVCKFRHMEITKNRKEIQCFWETQLAGCQKPHCAFFHEKPRCVDGILFPPDRRQSVKEQLHEEPSPLPATPIPSAANPQLRGVIKTESQEPVPSPTHPPVVINPADDDEDEDDQFSEEGDGPSPRKKSKPDEPNNCRVSTLEEIRLKRALKAGMNRASNSTESDGISFNGEKENIISTIRLPLNSSNEDTLTFEETLRSRGSADGRLGRRKDPTYFKPRESLSMKSSLAKRLGRFVKEEAQMPYQKGIKSIKERISIPSAPVSISQSAEEISTESNGKLIHIKTLEEIRMEKAAMSRSQKDCHPSLNKEITVTKTAPIQTPKTIKRTVGVQEHSITANQPPTEIHHTKRKRKENQLEQNLNLNKLKSTADNVPGKSQQEPVIPVPDTAKPGEVKVKTLEEIRQEKAARTQSDEVKSLNTEENALQKRRLLQNDRVTRQCDMTAEKSVDFTKKTRKAAVTPEMTSFIVKVKTFEEIMREKHLRKQEMAEKASLSQQASDAKASTKPIVSAGTTLKKILPPSPSSGNVPPTQNVLFRKLKTVKSNSDSPLNNTPVVTTVASVLTNLNSPEEDTILQHPRSFNKVPNKSTNVFSQLSSKQTISERLHSPAVESLTTDKTLTKDRKVRPKLNVKPSVMKPDLQVNSCQKRKRGVRSAVAAVKPLNSATIVLEESQETAKRDLEVMPSSSKKTEMSSSVSCSPRSLFEDHHSSSEELKTIQILKHSPSQETKLLATPTNAIEEYSAHSSFVLKTSQSKSRRHSVIGSRSSTSAADDLEDLINEFTDDHLDGEVDPGIGEDDLLQELSDMIGS